MKTYNIAASIVASFIFCALIFDAVMIYTHFFNEELNTKIVNKIDNIIY